MGKLSLNEDLKKALIISLVAFLSGNSHRLCDKDG